MGLDGYIRDVCEAVIRILDLPAEERGNAVWAASLTISSNHTADQNEVEVDILRICTVFGIVVV